MSTPEPHEQPPVADGEVRIGPDHAAPEATEPVDAHDVPPSRLHPGFVAIAAVQALGQLVVPIALAVVGLGGLSATGLIGAAVGVLAAGALGFVRWRSVRYRVSGGALRVRRGIVSPDERVIPIGRIAALDARRGLLQRAFGVVGLQVRTAGGGAKAEVLLEALDAEAASRLRRALDPEERAAPALEEAASDPSRSAGAGGGASGETTGTGSLAPGGDADVAPGSPEDGASAEVSLGGRRLVLAAATSPAIGLVGSAIAALVGVLAQAGDDVGVSAVRGAYDELAPATVGVLLVVVLVAGFLLLTWVVAFVLELVRLFGFRLNRDGGRLRIAHGLVPERRATVPLQRVRAVRVVEGLLRQPFGLAEVRLEIAGYAKDDASTQLLLPLVRRDELAAVLGSVLPELPLPAGAPPRPPARALRRALLRGVGLALVPAVALGIGASALGPPAAVVIGVVLLPLVLGASLGWAGWRAAGADLHGDVLRLRHRRLARTTLVADARRLQQMELVASPLDRRRRLRSVDVRVASARSFAVEDLDAGTAAGLLADVRARATAGARRAA